MVNFLQKKDFETNEAYIDAIVCAIIELDARLSAIEEAIIK